MKKFDFPLIADVLFYSASAWLILVGIFRWFRIPTGVCFAAATLLALALGAILYFFLSARHRRRTLGKKSAKRGTNLCCTLRWSGTSGCARRF